MDDEREPLVGYLARIVGSVMEHNYNAVTVLLEQRRAQFEAAGAGDILADLELELRAVFEPFLNVQDEGGR
jgi:hypothetical protein